MVSAFALPLWTTKIRNPHAPFFPFLLCQSRPQAIFRLFRSRESQQHDQACSFEKDLHTLSELPSAATAMVLRQPPARPDPDVVLVLGASGLLGREIVKELIAKPGCIVIACVRSRSDATNAGLEDISSRLAQPRPGTHNGHRSAALKILLADLSSDISYIATEAKRQCVGAVVFAASGGRNSKPGEIDNGAVRSLIKAMEPSLGAKGEAGELVIFDFQENASKALAAFCSVDDRVMGGVSRSQMMMSQERNTALFRGNVTTASNGGFAQVRGSFSTDDMGQAIPADFSSYEGVMIRCRGDGRRYKINIKDDEEPERVFQASFGTVRGDWQAIRLPFADFVPVRRGRIVYGDGPGSGIYASVLNTTRILSVGIVVSKMEPGGCATPGFEGGYFELELSRITAYRASTPRFLLVSSAAVTRPFWSEERKALAPGAVEIPIVMLNPSNILGHKLAGENAVRRGTIPWAIIRLTGLNDRVASGRKLLLQQGDTLTGTLSRADAAKGVVSALRSYASTWKTFELGAYNTPEDKETILTDDDFTAFSRDVLESQYGEQTDQLL